MTLVHNNKKIGRFNSYAGMNLLMLAGFLCEDHLILIC